MEGGIREGARSDAVMAWRKYEKREYGDSQSTTEEERAGFRIVHQKNKYDDDYGWCVGCRMEY